MTQEIGEDQAKDVGDIHEECELGQPLGEKKMDLLNNAHGRNGGIGGDCLGYCQNLLNNGTLCTKPVSPSSLAIIIH